LAVAIEQGDVAGLARGAFGDRHAIGERDAWQRPVIPVGQVNRRAHGVVL